MNIIIKKVVLPLIIVFTLLSGLVADFKEIKEARFSIFYEKDVNIISLEYVVKLLKGIDDKFHDKFALTNIQPSSLYLYNDTINFMNSQKVMWWQNYSIKSNHIALNNIELLLQQNSLHDILKYLIFYMNLNYFYHKKVPSWVINGLAIYYSGNKYFSSARRQFNSFNEFQKKIQQYTTQEEFKAAHYYCYKGIKYILDQYGEEKLFEYLNNVNTEEEFSKNFFNFFGISFQEYIQIALGLQ